jgi:hypothetical protein
MTVFYKLIRGAVISGSLGMLVACNEGVSDLVTNTPNGEKAVTAESGSSTPSGGGETLLAGPQGGAVVNVKCEKDVPPKELRSKISVDGNNLNQGRYRARVTSPPGSNPVVSAPQRTIGDEVEFDFDSKVDAGETPIPANYIQIVPGGPDVRGEILNAAGAVVVSQAVECEIDN